MFSERWLDASGRLSADVGLNTALMTCHDYVEEVAAGAHPRVYATFQRCLLRHLVCCVAARMLCSACPYNKAWQKGVAIEIQRIRSFAQRIERVDRDAAEAYLSMLSLLRTLLCAPDAFSVSAAYNTVRPRDCVCTCILVECCTWHPIDVERIWRLQLVARFGVLDVALLEAALRKHGDAERDDAMIDEAVSLCAEIMAMELDGQAEEEDAAQPALRPTMSTVAWRTASGVTDGAGRQPALMAHVEALMEAGDFHYIVPVDVLQALGLVR